MSSCIIAHLALWPHTVHLLQPRLLSIQWVDPTAHALTVVNSHRSCRGRSRHAVNCVPRLLLLILLKPALHGSHILLRTSTTLSGLSTLPRARNLVDVLSLRSRGVHICFLG